MNRTYRICLVVTVLLSTTACDQVTKRVAKAELISAEPVSLLKGAIRLEYAENPGAFLSLGQHLPAPILLLSSFLLAAAVICLLMRLSVVRRDVGAVTLIGLSLIAGGGVGNLVDRALNAGAVIDFMSVGVGGLRSGIFNLADVAISVGAMALLLSVISRRNRAGAA